MARLMIEELTTQEIKNLHNSGKKISFLLGDDSDFYFRATPGQLISKVAKEDGFRIAEAMSGKIDFQDYTEVVEDQAGLKYLKVGTKDNRDRRGVNKIIISEEFDAYVNKFGINSLRLKSEINLKSQV